LWPAVGRDDRRPVAAGLEGALSDPAGETEAGWRPADPDPVDAALRLESWTAVVDSGPLTYARFDALAQVPAVGTGSVVVSVVVPRQPLPDLAVDLVPERRAPDEGTLRPCGSRSACVRSLARPPPARRACIRSRLLMGLFAGVPTRPHGERLVGEPERAQGRRPLVRRHHSPARRRAPAGGV